MFLNIGRKVIAFIFFMLVLSVFVFILSRLAPGDPLQSFYGDRVEQMSMVEQEAARARLGLNAPLPVQYGKWLSNAAQGDFGISFKYRKPAIAILGALIGNTLLLGTIAYGLVFFLAVLLAVFCALHEETWVDRFICKLGTIVYYLPPFWLGLLLILVFSVNLHWLPSGGAYDSGQAGNIASRLEHMILPLTVMVTSHLWYYTYMIRNKLLDEVRKDYVLLAKAKGLTRHQIVWRHCLRNVAPSIFSIMAISVSHVLSGTYVVEAVFAYPGIGALSIESAKYHDYNLLMLVVLITGALIIVSSLLAQTVNEQIDPRMRVQEAGLWTKPMKHL
ncbi:ABC transporter permease [Sporomusa acidovorans]|uniref:Nickel transport system permease protein NikB n=1 Tax=Sporomusa acidovorans (strain ATCC 49682 / DSM 3132 / Mol) TaxID=1123286 RepID=A0ABZ3IXV6_SPOA4|nr:ABC transporter permease [Sporomusa acidovorans]OZC16968.1 nickel transport system permease protein NikB [Sporomusa acidovorans DSM 3132]SDE13991.1 peptide/nickel transport system permease protein [Sporomusa acidovorans]